MARILIIDDEAPIRKMLTILFERNQYEVRNACDGKQGTCIAQEFMPDLIITDLLMPEKEGIETIRDIKKINPDIKIIAISGGGVVQPEMYLKLALKMGADQSFTKPVDTATLLITVKHLLED
ncbi:MAG: response regulator [Pseudomonadota bacterium]